MGIVLETVQTVDGGRWEQPSLRVFPILLFFRSLYFQLHYLWAILFCLLLSFLIRLSFLLFLSFFCFVFWTHIISQFVEGYPTLLINLFPIPLPHISVADPKSFPWH